MARTAVTDAIEKALEIWDFWMEESIRQDGPALMEIAFVQGVSDDTLKVLTQMTVKFTNFTRRHSHLPTLKEVAYATAKEVSRDFEMKLRLLSRGR